MKHKLSVPTNRLFSLLLALAMVLTLLPPGNASAADSALPFEDVSADRGFYGAVQYVYENGLMNGTSQTQFQPYQQTTRAMLVTILHRMEGTPAAESNGFSDVADGCWYTDSVNWAAANGIVKGYSDGSFGPNDPVTREQMVTIFYRYAAYLGLDTSAGGSLSRYADADQVSAYAVEAMEWAVSVGLIIGVDENTLAPDSASIRARTATVIQRFAEKVQPGAANDPDLSLEGYTLMWQDEFDGEELNRDDWNVELHKPGWVNAELQEYVDSEENIYIEDGNLVLKPVKTENEDGTVSYTSGRVNTQGKQDFTYGIFEARVKVPTGMGYLPAFWLMASDENLYGQWPRCGEIDIMEIMGQNTTTSHGTVHYGNPHAQSQGTYVLDEGNFSDEFHTFAVEWEPGLMRWYVDGMLFHEESDWYSTTENQGTITYPAPFDQPFYVILNLAIGGSWVGYPDETTTFEDQAYMIDYVKVYQKDSYNENVSRPVQDNTLRDPDETGSYIVNGDFAVAEALDDEADWSFLNALGGVGSAQIADGSLNITTENAGTVDYSIQLVQPNVPMAKGGVYKLTFDASADEDRTVIVDVSAPERSWIRYLADTKINVGTEKQSYEFEFTMTGEDDPYGRLEFNLGNQGSTAGFHLSNVRLEKIDQIEIVEEKGALADGNYVYNGKFQEGEDRLAYWNVSGNAEVSVTNNSVYDRRLEVVAGEEISADNPVVIYQEDLALTSSSNYAISYSAEGPAGSTIAVTVAGHSAETELDGSVQSVRDAFIAPDGSFEKTVAFIVTQPGTYYIDDVRLVEDSLIKNGSFNAGTSGYEPYIDSSASAAYVVDSLTEDNAFDFTIENTGDQDWKIQLKQTNVNLVQGQWYRLKVDAKSDLDRKMMIALQRDGSIHGDDWMPYCQEIVDLTGEYQTYTVEFQMNPGTEPFSDPQTVLSISLGAVSGTQITTKHRVCIDNISLEKIDEPAAPIEPKPAGVELIPNGDFSDAEAGWATMAVTAPAAGTISIVDGKAVADITNVGTADWNVQMIQYGIQLDQGATYELTFTGSSTAEREIMVNLMSSTYDWYAGTGAVLTPEEQTFTLTFTMDKATNLDAGLFISMGTVGDGTPASTITLDSFSLKKVGGEDPAAENLITNGDFSDNDTDWDTMTVTSPAAGTLSVVDGKAVAEITDPGTADWNVQMIHDGITLEQGSTYTLSFTGSSTAERTIKACLMSTDGSYSWYGEIVPTLTAEEQTFSIDITMSSATDTNAGLYVSMGKTADNTPASTITLDNFVLAKAEEETPEDAVEPKPVGEELLANGDFSAADEGWTLNAGANTISTADGKATVTITDPGANDWDVQMVHYGIQLEQGCTYTVTFTASSTEERTIKAVLMSDSYTWYGGQDVINLTAEEQTITITFTMNEAANTNAGIFISMGKTADNTPASTIVLDNFSVTKVG